MRALSLFIASSFLAMVSFGQNSQTVTLVFVNNNNENKNYEAVIDEVSYYSETNTSYSKSTNQGNMNTNRNTIWLHNFQPGQHSVEVYTIKSGTDGQRANSSPVYSSFFTVREGFDTRITVRSNGQIQFSDRVTNSSSVSTNQNNEMSKTGDYTRNNDGSGNPENNNNAKMPPRNRKSHSETSDNNTNNNNENGTMTDEGSGDGNYKKPPSNGVRTKRDRNGNKTNGSYDDQSNSYNGKMAMDDNQFSQLLETIRKQWLPGAKMNSVRDEFVVSGNFFTTSQAKQLIAMVTDESNRLQLAKASYRIVTDPENFHQLDDLFRTQASKDELGNYVRNYQF